MEEHVGEISSIMEEGNREHAAKTPSMNPNNDGECEGDLSPFTLVKISTTEILEERAAKTPSIMGRDDGEHEVDSSNFTSSKGFIFRIPGLLKMHNEQTYMPYKFSIGPWHFGTTQLLHTGQNLKESIFKGLINCYPNPEAKRTQLVQAIENVHNKVIECYDGRDVRGERNLLRGYCSWGFECHKFIEMLLLDGCFIIQLFRKPLVEVSIGENDLVLFSGGMMQVLYHDLLLLENQIPWFVLEVLFDLTRDYPGCTSFTLVELAINFFSCAIFHHEPGELQRLGAGHDSNIMHLVDLVWRFLCFSSKMEVGDQKVESRIFIPSVTRLKEAGVKFQKAESGNIFNVRFDKGVLEIPPLLITPSTETIFRNLIIFEQCNHLCIPRVTCYAILLDCLVDTSDDVDLMSRAGIFNNCLNPEETAKFLNRVRDNIPIREFFYVKLCEDVNRYCKTTWPTWRASLIHNYFTKPWAIVSVIFAIIVLIFTIMQVFYK